VLSFGRRLGERTAVVVSGGLLAGGELEGEGRSYSVGAGWLASVTGAYRMLGGADRQLFAVTTLSMGFSRARIEATASSDESTLSASDLRVGAEVGVTLFERLRPFALARAFGGPVQFERDGETRIGSDQHHYAVGFGVGADATGGLDLRFETSLLGERSFTWSGALAF
jgi:hypothetical protein